MTITQNKLALHLAAELNGREYCKEITRQEGESARRDGLVVVYGASDDLMEFDGAIVDELGADDGRTAFVTRAGLVVNECGNDKCPHFERAQQAATPIRQLWCAEPGYSWTYGTAIPHATFEIVEDGKPYCRGIVFALEDVPA